MQKTGDLFLFIQKGNLTAIRSTLDYNGSNYVNDRSRT